MIDYKTLFSAFPVIDSQFDLAVIDAIKIETEDEIFYTPLIRFMMRNHEEKKVDAGLTLRTGAVCFTYEEIAEFINGITKLGFFLVDLGAYGTIYDESMNEIDDINWNTIMKSMVEIDKIDINTNTKPNYLH